MMRVSSSGQRHLAVCWLLLSVVLSIINAAPALAQSTGTSPQILPNLDLMLVVDESDSMWRTYGTGVRPADLAQRSVETLIDTFGVETLGSDFRVGIIVYGDEAQLVAPLTSLQQPANQTLLKEAFRSQHAPMGWSDAGGRAEARRQPPSRSRPSEL